MRPLELEEATTARDFPADLELDFLVGIRFNIFVLKNLRQRVRKALAV
jgi:hypothetical protein